MNDPMSDAQSQPEDAAAVAEAANDAVAGGWPEDLPPELARAAAKFATPAAALKSYVELERRLGRAVVVPDAEADETERRRFHRRLGVPDRPEDYPVAFPGAAPDQAVAPDIAERRSGFLAAMQAAGAPPAVVQAALDWFGTETGSLARARDGLAAQAEAEAEAGLRADWGAGFDRNLVLARRALQRFGPEEAAGLAETPLGNGGRLGSHPGFLRLLHSVGAGLLEDQALIGQPEPAGQALRERIDALHGLPPDRYKDQEVQSELRSLYDRLHGREGEDGTAGP